MAGCPECGAEIGKASSCRYCGGRQAVRTVSEIAPVDPWRHETPLPPEVTARYLEELKAVMRGGDVTGRLRGCACDKCEAYFAKQEPEWITEGVQP